MAKNIFPTVLLFLFMISTYAQQIHVKYKYVRSPIATLEEDLYIKDGKIISIQDSIITFSDDAVFGNGSQKTNKFHFVSNVSEGKNRDFFFTDLFDNDLVFIHDIVPAAEWKIDYNSTKKIAGYNCIKATSVFRGSPVTVFFTKEIPIDAGPFKFFGLPGLILDARVDGKDYDIWRTEKIDLDDQSKIEFTPSFNNFAKIEMKPFIEKRDEALYQNALKINKEFGSKEGLRFDAVVERFNIEKRFEWEQQNK